MGDLMVYSFADGLYKYFSANTAVDMPSYYTLQVGGLSESSPGLGAAARVRGRGQV